MVTLSFQQYVISWWKQRQNDVKLGRKLEILNLNELKACIRRNFVPLSYDKNKKLKEEIKDLVEKQRKSVDGEKEFIREKLYREKLEALTKKKE